MRTCMQGRLPVCGMQGGRRHTLSRPARHALCCCMLRLRQQLSQRRQPTGGAAQRCEALLRGCQQRPGLRPAACRLSDSKPSVWHQDLQAEVGCWQVI